MVGGVNKYDEVESFCKVNSKFGIRVYEIEDCDWEIFVIIDFFYIFVDKCIEIFEICGGFKIFEMDE